MLGLRGGGEDEAAFARVDVWGKYRDGDNDLVGIPPGRKKQGAGLKRTVSGQSDLGQVMQALQDSGSPSVKWACDNHSICIT